MSDRESFFVKTSADVLADIHALINEHEPLVAAQVRGNIFFLTNTLTTEAAMHSAPLWVLRAQIGSLEKMATIFTEDSHFRTFELLAIARNLFENLVWLRLFNLDPQYGLVFFAQLLEQQRETTERMLAKVREEITLFEQIQEEESAATKTFAINAGRVHHDREQLRRLADEYKQQEAERDKRVRRKFVLYGAAATFNSYGYQAHILQNEVVPKHQKALQDIAAEKVRFDAAKGTLLSASMAKRAAERWNWRARANDVGMADQYDFLYVYISKLMHSTPMNLITEKELSKSEAILMLEYAYISISDIFDEIERFTFPGKVNAAFFEMDAEQEVEVEEED